jgi:tetratricopeptide (TPR) repeat protein
VKRYDEAVAAFDQVILLDPTNAQAMFDKGGVHLEQQQWEMAVNAYEQATDTEPNYVAAFLDKAITLIDLGRSAEALTHCETAIRIDAEKRAVDDPPYALSRAHAIKGAALLSLGRHDEALVAIDVAMNSRPDDPLVHRHRSIILRKLGRHEEAQHAYRIYEEHQNRQS